jgi:integrase
MGLHKRKDSELWQICVFANGKKVRMSTKTTNKKIAQKIHDKIKGQIAEGTFQLAPGRTRLSFDQMVDEFLEKHSKVEKASYERDTYIGKNVKKYFKSTPLDQIKPYNIKCWRQWRSKHTTNRGPLVSKATLNRELAFLKTMFNMAVEWDYLEINPAIKLKQLRGEKQRMRFLNSEEVRSLIHHSSEYLKPIVITAISTGMRRGEILDLKWEHVDLKHRFLRVVKSKNSDSRDLPINEFLYNTLVKLEKSRRMKKYVFCKEDGSRRKCIKEAFNKASRDAGLGDLWFHDLRHTYASLNASGGCDLITLKNLLGHKTLAMTQRYAHFIPNKYDKTKQIMQDFWSSCEVQESTKRNPHTTKSPRSGPRAPIKKDTVVTKPTHARDLKSIQPTFTINS